MTLGRLSQDQNNSSRTYRLQQDGMCGELQLSRGRPWFGFVLGLCLFGFPLVAFADDQPQELPKPVLKTTPPLFEEWQFDSSALHAIPEGFVLLESAASGEGWWMVNEGDATPSRPNLVEQELTCGEAACYQLLMVEGKTAQYFDFSVRMKMRLGTPSGKAGLAYGVQDAKNFYAVVVEPKTNEVVAYVVKDGHETELAREALILEPSEWHFLRIQRQTIVSKEFTEISFDHHLLIDVYDQSFDRGQFGLVAMGDGAFAFDNLRAMESLTNRPLSRPAAY